MNQDFRLESQEPGQAPAWNPLELILLLATRYRRTILIVTVIGVVVSLGLALAVPNRYTSAGQVLVRLGQREQMPTDIVAEDGRVSTGGGRGAVANEYQLLKNPLLFERVARRVGVEEVLRPYDPASWDGESTPTLKRLLHSMQSWWFRTFTDGSAHLCEKKEQCGDCLTAATQKLMSGEATTLRVMPRTDIITVAHTAHDPDLARRITAAFLEVFDERNQEVFATNPALEFLSAQHATATEAAAAADLELARYRAECGVHDYPTQIHNHLNTVHELRKRISNDRGSLNGLETLRVKLDGKTAGLPALVPQPVGPQHVANPDYQILKETLSRLQMELFELRNTYAEDTEVVKAKERAIERVRGDLEGQPQFVALDRPDIQVPNPELTRLRNQ
ncbi:MAG: hypothetical protein ACE5GW_05290, partial [Planctomycetota bacterium]